ncbi:MAG TPA: metal-sulfur cluster assembly factor [Longimicrobiales bacterium]
MNSMDASFHAAVERLDGGNAPDHGAATGGAVTGGGAAGDAAAPAPSTPGGEAAHATPSDAPPAVDLELALDALRTVIDPEIGLDIVTLGLVYELAADGGTVTVTFTLTTPGCPLERHITNGILNALSAVPGVTEVRPNLVWEPRWNPSMIQEGAW